MQSSRELEKVREIISEKLGGYKRKRPDAAFEEYSFERRAGREFQKGKRGFFHREKRRCKRRKTG
jgi:hypothetical protein